MQSNRRISGGSISESSSVLPELYRVCSHYRHLLFEMTRRELLEQHAAQVLGAIWALVHPLFLMALYVFIFSAVFKVRVGGTADMPLDYTVYLLSGLVPWLGCVQILSKSVNALTSNAGLVKQVVFPIEILALKSVLASLIPQLVSFVALLIYVTIKYGVPPASWLAVPVVVALQLIMMSGIAFFLSIIGAFIRDLREITQLFILAGAYLMPVFYLPAWVPRLFKPILWLNPFSYLIWVYQDVLYFGHVEHPVAWVVLLILAPASLIFGYRLFRSLKHQVASVL